MNISICGAGNGGIALFGDLSRRGQQVKIYSDPNHRSKLDHILKSGGYFNFYKGTDEHSVRVKFTLDDNLNTIEDLVMYSDVIYNTTPITVHNEIFTKVWDVAWRLNKRIIFINLSGGFAIYSQSLIQKCNPLINLGTTEIFPYACRVEGLNCYLFMQKRSIQIGFTQKLTPTEHKAIGNYLADVLLEYNPNLLEVALGSVNYIMHPTITLLNINRINSAEQFLFYRTGITPAISRLLTEAEQERIKLAEVLGYTKFQTTPQRVSSFYGGDFSDWEGLSKGCKAYMNIKGPTSINSRYIWEDIPCGLVALATLGELCGIEMITIKTIINLGVAMTGQNYWNSEYNFLTNSQLRTHVNLTYHQ